MRALRNLLGLSFVVGITSCAASQALATQIAAESYVNGSPGYASSGNLDGNPTGTPPSSFGFTGTYVGATGIVANTTTGLDAAQFTGETGGGVNMFMRFNSAASTGTRQSNRALAGGYSLPADNTYWFSGIMRTPNVVPSGQFALMGFTNFASSTSTAAPASPVGVMWGIDGGNVVVRARDTADVWTTTPLATSYATGTTDAANLVFIAKLEYQTALNGAASPTEDRLTVWLNPADASSEAALGAPNVKFATNALTTGTDITRLNYFAQTQFTTTTDRAAHRRSPRDRWWW
jgi:hypothetical protein